MLLSLGLDFRMIGFECRTLGLECRAIGVQRHALGRQFGSGLFKLAGRGTQCSRRLLTGTRLFLTEFCPATRLFVVELRAEPGQFGPLSSQGLAGDRQLVAFLFETGIFLSNALMAEHSGRRAEARVELIFWIVRDARQTGLEAGAEGSDLDFVAVRQRPGGDGSAVDPRGKPGPQVANPQTAGKDGEHEMSGGDVGTAELDVAAGPTAAERCRAENILDDAAAIAAGDHQAGVAAGVGRVGDSRKIRFDAALELTDLNDVSRREGGDVDSLAVDPGAAGRAQIVHAQAASFDGKHAVHGADARPDQLDIARPNRSDQRGGAEDVFGDRRAVRDANNQAGERLGHRRRSSVTRRRIDARVVSRLRIHGSSVVQKHEGGPL